MISDENASLFYELWKHKSADDTVVEVLHSKELWGADLSYFHEFIAAVKKQLHLLMENGAMVTLLQSQQR